MRRLVYVAIVLTTAWLVWRASLPEPTSERALELPAIEAPRAVISEVVPLARIERTDATSPSALRDPGTFAQRRTMLAGAARTLPEERRSMTIPRTQKITPHLWYATQAEEAARFYTGIFPDSRVERVTPLPVDSPSGPAGSVKMVEFTLFGQPFMAISAGPLDPFNQAISLVVTCDDQAELDRYWTALSKGGSIEQCGWLKDKFGVSWQIVPSTLGEMIAGPDREKARRVAEAMMKMVKLDFAVLQAAYQQR